MNPRRIEIYCAGHLVKEIDQVEVPDFTGTPYATREEAAAAGRAYRAELGDAIPRVDGCWRWLLDGNEITAAEAEAYAEEYSR